MCLGAVCRPGMAEHLLHPTMFHQNTWLPTGYVLSKASEFDVCLLVFGLDHWCCPVVGLRVALVFLA